MFQQLSKDVSPGRGEGHGVPARLSADSAERRRLRPGALAGLALVCAAAVLGLAGCKTESSDANSLVGSPNGAKEVSFKTDDDWHIFADAYVPPGESHGVVILLHQRNGAASDWSVV